MAIEKRRERKKTEKKKINIKQRIIQKNSSHVVSLASKQQASLAGKKRHPTILTLRVMSVCICCYLCEELETREFRGAMLTPRENNESLRSITSPQC